MSTVIRPIDSASAQRIVAGQAVTDLASVVKELVDNALDAGATVINIRLFDQGSSIIEVSDDGCGIPEESRHLICSPHATSKLVPTASAAANADYNILQNVSTLGFRGEALFSLANLSKALMVATRTADEELAVKLEFKHDGSVRPERTQQLPKKIGTTVAVVNFLERVPVRRQDFLRRLVQQRSKLLRRMEAYFVFCTGISMHLMDMIGTDYFNSSERTLLQTNATCKTLPETVSCVLGTKVVASLCEVTVDLVSAFENSETFSKETTRQSKMDDQSLFCVEGLVSHANPPKKLTGVQERHLFAINRRPVEMPKLSKRLNQLWKMVSGAVTGNGGSKSFLILHFSLPSATYDVNLEPDKRKVVLENEDRVFGLLYEHIAQVWSQQTGGNFRAGLLTKSSNSNEELACDGTALGVDEDEEDADDEDALDDARSPGRFTRRYAFANDVRRMRLQHQFDDGRATAVPEQEEARRKEVLAELAEKGCESSDEEDEIDVDLQIANEHEAYRDREGVEIDEEGDAARCAQITPLTDEHRQAEALDDRLRTSTAPTLPLEMHRRLAPSELRQSRIAQKALGGFSEPQTAATNVFDKYRNEKNVSQIGLESFGFKRLRSSQTSSTASSKQGISLAKQSLDENQTSDAKRHRWSAVAIKPSQCTVMGSMTQPLIDKHTGTSDQRRVSLDRCRSPPSADGEDASNDEDSIQPPIPGRCRTGQDRADSSIVFKSCMGTQDVVLRARRERLAMRDRRLHYTSHAENEGISQSSEVISLSKEDFSSMKVIGQFNLGFILAMSRDNHLWILDQHACDEKYNFEKLMTETVISEQRLISPMNLELMPAEESCIIDNMEIFEKNGFRFQIDWEKPPRHRLALTALPQSGAPDGRKSVQFGKEDVIALCRILGVDESYSSHEGALGSGTGADGSGMYGNNAVRRYTAGSKSIDAVEKVIARLPKAIAMFASRACRGSIMIGQALSQKEMDRIVKRLKDVEHPWNCPHGRPTMRHALALESLLRGDDQKARELIGDTAATMMSQDEACSDDQVS